MAGEVRWAAHFSLMSSSQHFLLPLMSRMARSLYFSLCRGFCQVFLNTLPFCLLLRSSVTLNFKPDTHPRFCPLQQLTGDPHYVAVRRAKLQETLAGELDFVSCCRSNKQKLVCLCGNSAEEFFYNGYMLSSKSDLADRW